jgi:outer membrane protein assembly factor BamB
LNKEKINKIVILIIMCLFLGTSIIPNISGDNSSNNIKSSNTLCSDWPKFHYDDMNRGFSWATGSAPNNVLWSNKISNHIWYTSPIIANNKLYIGAQDGLYCLDTSNGNVLWDFDTTDVWSTPMYDSGKIYFGTQGDKFYCLDAGTGDEIWSEFHSENVDSSPNMYDGKVFYGDYDGVLHCKDADLGYPHWSYPTGDAIRSSPAIYSYAIYFGSQDHKFYCINADGGYKEWEFTTGDSISSSPSMCYGNVYFGSNDNKVYCLNADYGDKIWEFETSGGIYSSPAVEFGRVYFGSKDWNFYCLDAYTGELIWNYGTGFPIYSSPGIADDRVYFGSDDHKIYCFDADPSDGNDEGINDVNGATYDLIWTYDTGDEVSSSPAIVDNKMYIASEDGTVYCFGQGGQNQAPVADFTYSPSNPQEGDTVYFDASNSYDDGSIVSYLWDFDDDGQFDDGTGVTESYIFYNEGSHPVSLKVTDNQGLTDVEEKTVYVSGGGSNDPPVADFLWTPSNPIIDQTITFDASASSDDGSIVSYLWDFDNDGSFDDGNGLTDTYSYSNAGNHPVSLRVMDDEGLTDTKTKTVYVSGGSDNDPPIADFIWSPSSPNEEDTVTFDASASYDPDGSIISYQWDFDNDGQFDDGTGEMTTYSWSVEGNYPVSLKVTDDDGESDIETKTISVGNVNKPPNADFSFYPNPGIENEPVNFDASSSSDDGSIISYSWEFGDGNSGSGMYTSHTYVYSDYFEATLTVTDNDGLIDSETKTIPIGSGENIRPTVDITYPDDGDELSGTITITGTASDLDGSIYYVEIQIDTEPWQTASGTNVWSKTWNTHDYSDTLHTISARSYDGKEYSSVDSVTVSVQNGGQNEYAELPEFDVNDIWNYNVQNLEINYGNANADGQINNFQAKVIAKNFDYYTLEGSGEFVGSGQLEVQIGENEIIIPINNIEQEFSGEIRLDTSTLGVERIEGEVEIPFDLGLLYYKVVYSLVLSTDTPYDFYDFPIEQDETWIVAAKTFRYQTETDVYQWFPVIGWNVIFHNETDTNIVFDKHTCTCTEVLNGNFKVESDLDNGLYYWYSSNEDIQAITESVGSLMFYGDYITIDYEMILSGCPPNKPNAPIGKSNPKAGETYQYSSSTIDPNGDIIQYGWDWNGDKKVDEWTQFFESAETCVISHKWTSQELNAKKVYVKARDINNEESPWSDPLELESKRLIDNNFNLFDFINKISTRFPVLLKILFNTFFSELSITNCFFKG